MKKKTAYILLGVFLTTSILGGCGSKNKATEAASESAQTEKEGAGEAEELTVTPTPEEEKDTEKKADSSEDAEASTQSNRVLLWKSREKKLRFSFRMKKNGAEMQIRSRVNWRRTDMSL